MIFPFIYFLLRPRESKYLFWARLQNTVNVIYVFTRILFQDLSMPTLIRSTLNISAYIYTQFHFENIQVNKIKWAVF